MSRVALPMVGNEFIVPQRRLQVSAPAAPAPVRVPDFSVLGELSLELSPESASSKSRLSKLVDLFHRYSLGAFALLFLLVFASAIQVASIYMSARIIIDAKPLTSSPFSAAPKHSPNSLVKTSKLNSTMATISGQSITIAVGDKTANISPEMIKSWIQVVNDKAKGVSYLHVDQGAINKSLGEAAAPYIKTPLNQVSTTNASGVSQIIAAGKNGIKLGDTSDVGKQIGQSLLGAKGMQLTLPTETQAFAVTTIADFDKLIEVNVVTKQMYLYEKGQLTHTYPVSAGAPATPTPIGQYKIYEKLAVQDMRGFNANGTKYFQPHVRWINYFLPGGYAVHGNYWRPQSWFGAVNSSHGCVSLPDDQAKEVYDWAPIGTTVITHN